VTYGFSDASDTNTHSQLDKTAAENGEILLASCTNFVNPILCPGGGTADPVPFRELKKDPNYRGPEGILDGAEPHEGIIFKNPFANHEGDALTSETNRFKNTYDSEKDNRGNTELQQVSQFRGNTVWKDSDNYALLTEGAIAAGEATLGRGSKLPYLELDRADKSYPRYVLNDHGYYDLGSNALDYLYTGLSALQDLRTQPDMAGKEQDLQTQKDRINLDVNIVQGTADPKYPHDMSKILDDLSGDIYKDYGTRFTAWKSTLEDKFNRASHPDQPNPYIYEAKNLDGTLIAKYQAKACRDIALIDMALIRNDAGDKHKLLDQMHDVLGRAEKLDPDNPDFKQVQELATKF
jgi:hypothetical protein